jgi:FKBP-type peptidyl-prolyl cis-trans isomerase FkpA
MWIKIVFILLIFSYASCRRAVQDYDDSDQAEVSTEESFVKINRYLLKRHQDQISAYAKRKSWNMQSTETGLWYEVLREGNGAKASKGKIISLHYTVSLLDGTICDSSDQSSPKSFRIGQGGVEAGLEEGVLLLREGDKARLIMPPHMAHGNFGDRDKIPPGAILIYEIEILSIQ